MITIIAGVLLNIALIYLGVWIGRRTRLLGNRAAVEKPLPAAGRTPEERIARGQQAERAMEQFLSPAFDYVVADYVRRLTEIASEQPWETDKIRKLAAATKIARTVQASIAAFVHDGEAALKEKRAADRMENMTDEQGRWAKMAGGLLR